MKKGQKSTRGGYQDLLCPFTTVYVTQWSGGNYTHRGTKAYDVRGAQAGVRYAYYAPCDIKCVKTIPSYGEAIWQSLEKVRFADGTIDYCTFTTVHDSSFDAKVGLVRKQGEQIGNMGTKGNATGVHCHIEVTKGKKNNIFKNKYGIYTFMPYKDEILPRNAFFMDNTVIKKWFKPRYLKDVVTSSYKTVNVKEGLNMRTKAGIANPLITTLKYKTKVEYLSDSSNIDGYLWCKIKYNGKTGYVVKNYLK